MIKYTFLLPAYKATFLKAAINSILNQTYRDFSLIVSDDCSPEDLYSIVNSFHDERVTYIRNEKNVGGTNLVNHWNKLVDMCSSDYLILASDDDLYEPTFLEDVDKLVCKYPEVDFVRARIQMIDENEEVFWEDIHYEELLSELKFCCYNPNTCVANNVFKTSALKQIGGFITFPLAWGSDLATEMAMSVNGVANTDKVLFKFRQSGINISSLKKNKKADLAKLNAVFEFHEWANIFIPNIKYEDNQLNRDFIDKIIIRVNDVVFAQCLSSSWALSFSKYISLFFKLKKEGYFYKRSVAACSIRYFLSRFK